MVSVIKTKTSQLKGLAAHHIIPIKLADHKLFRRLSMDLDAATNGIFLTGSAKGAQHVGGHPNYIKAVSTILDDIDNAAGRMTNNAKRMDFINQAIIDLQRSTATLLREGMELLSDSNTVETWINAIKTGMEVM